ncbi:hypothetical protein V2J09_019802 [Rumex salicifolius]
MNAKKKQAEEKAQPPAIKLVKLDKAYKLAMQWVNDMSGRWEDEQADVELEGRPSKLGLGAEINRRNEFRPPNKEATEWKLRAMLDLRKRKSSIIEDSTPDVKSDDEEDESESRCNAFAKKRVYSAIVPVLGKKKRRK